MQESVVEAHKAFGEERFLDAAEAYAQAFRSYNDYNLKKNEMIAWFKNGSCSPALEAADLYFKNGKDITEDDRVDLKSVRVRCELASAKKTLNTGNLEGCESHLLKAEEIISADARPPVKDSDEYREILEIRAEIEILKRASVDEPLPMKSETNYLGPILVGAGTVVGATGLVLILSSLSDETDLQCTTNVANPSCNDPQPTTRDTFESESERIQTLNTIGWVTSLVGVTTIGVGSVLWLTQGSVSASIDPVKGNYSASVFTRF